MKKLALLSMVLSGCSGESTDSIESEVVARAASITKIRVDGDSSDALLSDPNTGTNGFVNVGRDNIAGTTSLDFSYATPTSDPDVITLVQGSGLIPNDAFTTTSSSAQLTLAETPFDVLHCAVNLVTGEFTCAIGATIPWNLTWASNGFSEVEERVQRTQKLGPLTVKEHGGYDLRSALVNGTWNGNTAVDMMGNLLDTRNFQLIREITMPSVK